MTELRVQLGDVDVAVRHPGGHAGGAGRLGVREVAHAETVRLDAVLDPADPGGPLRHLAGEVAGREHDGRGAVGDREDVGVAQRMVRDRLLQHVGGGHVALAHRVRIALRVPLRTGRDLGEVLLGRAVRIEERARLERGQVDHRRPLRQHVVRVELQAP